MSDLRTVLPHFPAAKYASLLALLEKHNFTTADLLVLDATEIGKRTKLPLLDLQYLSDAVLAALHRDLGVPATPNGPPEAPQKPIPGPLNQLPRTRSISTLCPELDHALGGGIPVGYVTEVTGESGVGKTQFLLSLLLAVQLPPPHGLGRPAIYISTEAPLATSRLEQILANNPLLKSVRKAQWANGTMLAGLGRDEDDDPHDQSEREKQDPGTGRLKYPSLDGILSTTTPDLESQEHILTYQVPVEIERRNAGLLILDSVAANYRAEFERGAHSAFAGSAKSKSRSMGARSNDLVKLGFLLRDLARRHSMAVVVSNQVSDRIHEGGPRLPATGGGNGTPKPAMGSSLASRSGGPPPSTLPGAEPTSSMAELVPPHPRSSIDTSLPMNPQATPEWADQLHLDYQQRWFTGWGDDPDTPFASKTPSLGLVWATQIACRLALIKLSAHFLGSSLSSRPFPAGGGGGNAANGSEGWERNEDGNLVPKSEAAVRKTWRRWMKVVFAPHVAASRQGLGGAVEYDITMGGLKGLSSDA